ncbi:MAG: alpha/beta hydrolase family protein [Rubrivivax sp.]
MPTPPTSIRHLAACWAAACLSGAPLAWANPPANASAGRKPPPASAFFSQQVFAEAKLSPDGRHVAATVGSTTLPPRLVVLPLDTLKPQAVAGFGDSGVGRFSWVNAERLVFALDDSHKAWGQREYAPGLFAVNHDGQRFRQLVNTMGEGFVRDGDNLAPLLPWKTFLLGPVGAQDSPWVHVVVPEVITTQEVGYIHLQQLHTGHGQVRDVDTPAHAVEWLFNAQGQPQWVFTERQGRVGVHRRQPDGTWLKVADVDGLDGLPFAPTALDAGGQVFATARDEAGRDALFRLNPDTGSVQQPAVLASPDFDVHATPVMGPGGRVLGWRYLADARTTHWLDAGMQTLQSQVNQRLPHTVNELSVPSQAAPTQVLVRAYSDRQPDKFYLYETATRRLRALGEARPDIDASAMGGTDVVKVRARDGLLLPTWITLPPGLDLKTARNLPMVVLVHGGPHMRGREWRWQAEAQFLASRGYVVLEPEFRGSRGYGDAHYRAGWRQWGLKMQDDIADATRWAVGRGLVDGRRVCIAGGSYGGYAALMGLVNDAALYRCAVSWAGPTDLGLLYSIGWSDTSAERKQLDMPRRIGHPVHDAAQFKATSPLQQAARIQAPVLLAYGRRDLRVPIDHGEKLRDALKAAGRPPLWIEYAEEGHGWALAANRIDFWQRVEAFLAQHLTTPQP